MLIYCIVCDLERLEATASNKITRLDQLSEDFTQVQLAIDNDLKMVEYSLGQLTTHTISLSRPLAKDMVQTHETFLKDLDLMDTSLKSMILEEWNHVKMAQTTLLESLDKFDYKFREFGAKVYNVTIP